MPRTPDRQPPPVVPTRKTPTRKTPTRKTLAKELPAQTRQATAILKDLGALLGRDPRPERGDFLALEQRVKDALAGQHAVLDGIAGRGPGGPGGAAVREGDTAEIAQLRATHALFHRVRALIATVSTVSVSVVDADVPLPRERPDGR